MERTWPYPIPENWRWTRLGNITKVVGGGTPPSKVEEYYAGGGIPWISPADLSGCQDVYISHGAKNITALGLERSSARLVPAGTVCLSTRAPIGYVAIAKNELCTNQGFKSFLPASCYLPEYLYWYLKGNRELLESYASGTTFLELSGKKAALVEFPLAPYAEQRRIAARIESLFAKLDNVKERVQAVIDGFEPRRSAILHKAFTGELTERWRKEHGVGLDSWKNQYLKDICQYMKAGGDKPADFSEAKDPEHCIPVVANGTVEDGIIGYTAEAKYEAGTVTVSGRGTIGYSTYRDYPIYPVVRLIVLCPTTSVLPEFLKYAFDAYPEEGTGSSIPQLTVPSIKKKKIPTPIQEEQAEIVHILKDLHRREQQALSAAEAILSQIELLKKTILARAFRGELGTNDLTEPPPAVDNSDENRIQ